MQPATFLMDLAWQAASVTFPIRDCAGQFTSSFDAVFAAEGIRILASPPQAPRANAIPQYQQDSRDAADPADHAGQTADPPVIFWSWRGQRAIEMQEPAVR